MPPCRAAWIFSGAAFALHLLVVLPSSSYAAGAGTTAAEFLKFDAGARPLALGGAYAALGDDVYGLFWNPASIALLDQNQVGLTDQELGEEIRNDAALFASPQDRLHGTVAGSVIYQDVGAIQGYDTGGVATNQLTDQDLALSGAYATHLTHDLTAGVQAKWIHETLDTKSADSGAADLGVLYQAQLPGLRFGASLMNLGPGIRFISQTDPLPTEFRAGSAYALPLLGGRSAFAVDGALPFHDRAYFSAGVEHVVDDVFAMRLGYQTNDDLSNGLRVGFGVLLRNISFDYAYLPRGPLQSAHRFSLTIRFGKSAEAEHLLRNVDEHLLRGKEALQGGDLVRAYRELDSVLAVEPGNAEAQALFARVRLLSESAVTEKQTTDALAEGTALYQRGDITGARAQFEAVLKLDPANAKAKDSMALIDRRFAEIARDLLGKGKKYLENGSLDDAQKQLETVLGLQPDNKEAASLITEVNAQRKRLAEIALQDKVKRLYASGMGYVRQGQWEKAKKEFETLLALRPDDPEAAKQLKAAQAKIDQAMADAYDEKGKKAMAAAKWQEAADDFETALEADPDHPGVSDALKKAKAALALENAAKIQELTKQVAELYSKGDYAKAEGLLKEILRIDPENLDAKRYLDKVHSLEKEEKKAP